MTAIVLDGEEDLFGGGYLGRGRKWTRIVERYIL